jgi:predicted metal-dependent HD superfamily phosphohydrolase
VAQTFVAFQLVASQWGAPAELVEVAYDDIVARYGEPQRHYHTLEHIGEVLERVHGTEVELAAWFHDIIYDTTAPDSEAQSAVYAGDVLRRLGAPPEVISEVQRLIELTAGHVATDDDVTGQQLIAADLAILSSDRDRYERYARDVRAEYAHVDDATWRAGRTALLKSLLATTPDQRARSNLARELSTLSLPQA